MMRSVPCGHTASAESHGPAAILFDDQGNVLEPGALYCCIVQKNDAQGRPFDSYEQLVWYCGMRGTKPVFLDAENDLSEVTTEVSPDWDKLARQIGTLSDIARQWLNG